MKSLWAQYIAEREGNSVIEEPWGFVEYHIALPFICIDSFFVLKEMRHPVKTRSLLNHIVTLGKDAGATHIWSQVCARTINATSSLRSVLAHGFTVQDAQNGSIILIKEII